MKTVVNLLIALMVFCLTPTVAAAEIDTSETWRYEIIKKTGLAVSASRLSGEMKINDLINLNADVRLGIEVDDNGALLVSGGVRRNNGFMDPFKGDLVFDGEKFSGDIQDSWRNTHRFQLKIYPSQGYLAQKNTGSNTLAVQQSPTTTRNDDSTDIELQARLISKQENARKKAEAEAERLRLEIEALRQAEIDKQLAAQAQQEAAEQARQQAARDAELARLQALAELMEKQDRRALIIGNSSYASRALRNPVNDARLMDDTLSQVGFKTTLVENGDRRSIRRAIQSFSKGLSTDSVALFYFAGHGVEVDGRNYLIPINAEIESEADVEFEAIDAGWILKSFQQARTNLNLLVFDACRDNPYAMGFRSNASRGLKAMRPSQGSLVLYATGPGNVAADGDGDNSLFTQYLSQSILEPGLKIEETFKRTAVGVNRDSGKSQTPYMEGVILSDFYFSPQ